MNTQFNIRWSNVAANNLRGMSHSERLGVMAEVDALQDSYLHEEHKPLKGPLQGLFHVVFGRYRVVYQIAPEKLADGSYYVNIIILFIAEGERKEVEKSDVFKVAKRLYELGMISNSFPNS
jgi:mRNA-degrading endonuclease RelE of RelBE toxin-antitoxin system